MQSLMHDRDWSRRRFLLLGTAIPVFIPGISAAARPAFPALAPGDPSRQQAALAIASSGHLPLQWPAGPARVLVLQGDRLSRLGQLRQLLTQLLPSCITLHLDATDQVMWAVASSEAGVTVMRRGAQLELHYPGTRTHPSAREAGA
jgi:hypothetical protein